MGTCPIPSPHLPDFDRPRQQAVRKQHNIEVGDLGRGATLVLDVHLRSTQAGSVGPASYREVEDRGQSVRCADATQAPCGTQEFHTMPVRIQACTPAPPARSLATLPKTGPRTRACCIPRSVDACKHPCSHYLPWQSPLPSLSTTTVLSKPSTPSTSTPPPPTTPMLLRQTRAHTPRRACLARPPCRCCLRR